MLCEVDRRRFVRRREVVDDQLVLIGERIRHSHVEVARIAFLTIGTRVPQLERRCAARRTPHALVKSLAAAVQMIRTDVRGELVGLSVQRKARVGNAVGATADDGAEVLGIVMVLLDVVEADHDIHQMACAVWREQRHDDAAVVGRAKLEVRALEREDVGYGRRVISKM